MPKKRSGCSICLSLPGRNPNVLVTVSNHVRLRMLTNVRTIYRLRYRLVPTLIRGDSQRALSLDHSNVSRRSSRSSKRRRRSRYHTYIPRGIVRLLSGGKCRLFRHLFSSHYFSDRNIRSLIRVHYLGVPLRNKKAIWHFSLSICRSKSAIAVLHLVRVVNNSRSHSPPNDHFVSRLPRLTTNSKVSTSNELVRRGSLKLVSSHRKRK